MGRWEPDEEEVRATQSRAPVGPQGSPWPQGSQAWLVREQSREDRRQGHTGDALWRPLPGAQGRARARWPGKKQPLKKGSSTPLHGWEAEAHGAQSEPVESGQNCQGTRAVQKWRLH